MQSPLLDTAPTITDVPANQTIALDIAGMKCAGCVKAVENQLTQHPGVISATVNLVTEVAMVEYCPEIANPTDLAHRLTDIGFPTQPRQSLDDPDEISSDYIDPAERHRQEAQAQLWRVAIASILLLLSGIGHLDHFGWHVPGLSAIEFHWGLATLALIGPGRSILVDGWRGLRHNIPNMNSLIGLGAVTAYTTSVAALLFPQLGWECFFDEPVMLLGFILLGRTLEQQARTRAAAAMQSLIALKPTLARLIPAQDSNVAAEATSQTPWTPSSAVEIAADNVKVGEWLQVLPGEKIPVDGQVLAGQTTVNEAMLTGESTPVAKQPGDLVAAGTLNQTGAIAIRATRTGKDTTIAQIIALVETAQTRKAPIQRLADTIAGYFTYGVMAIALLTFLFWYFVGIPLFGETAGVMTQSTHLMHTAHVAMMLHPSPLLLSLKLAIAVLVIACPCALGLATPTAILVGCGVGAERGLLIRGGDVLEKVHRLQTIVFDKTGTLTTGHPVITDCLPLGDMTPTRLLQLAATVESGTRHPLAEAIRQGAQQQELLILPAQDFQTEVGQGVSAQIEGQMVRVGTADWLLSVGASIPETAQAKAIALSNTGKTICYVAIGTTVIGLIAIQDTLRSDAQQTVQKLQQMGLRVMMLTGDHPAVASAIAHSLGIATQDVFAEVRPEAKAATISQLQQQGSYVAMIGDGINDAPALAQANVSIALHSSTAVAIETAEIVLMRDRLQDVVEAIRLSRAAFNTIRQNLFWAFAYNIVGIPIAAGVLLPTLGVVLSPSVAGAIMAFSSVSVVANSLFLRRMVKD